MCVHHLYKNTVAYIKEKKIDMHFYQTLKSVLNFTVQNRKPRLNHQATP